MHMWVWQSGCLVCLSFCSLCCQQQSIGNQYQKMNLVVKPPPKRSSPGQFWLHLGLIIGSAIWKKQKSKPELELCEAQISIYAVEDSQPVPAGSFRRFQEGCSPMTQWSALHIPAGSGWISALCHGKFMRHIREGSGKRGRERKEREDTPSERAAGLCAQMCRRAAAAGDGVEEHVNGEVRSPRNERTGPRPPCSRWFRWALEMNSCQLWGKSTAHTAER